MYKCHKCHHVNNANIYYNVYNAFNRNVPKRERSQKGDVCCRFPRGRLAIKLVPSTTNAEIHLQRQSTPLTDPQQQRLGYSSCAPPPLHGTSLTNKRQKQHQMAVVK